MELGGCAGCRPCAGAHDPLWCKAVVLVDAGIEPPVFRSSNVDGGDALNEHLYEQYYGYFK